VEKFAFSTDIATYLRNGTRQAGSYYGSLIGSHRLPTVPCHFQWCWVIYLSLPLNYPASSQMWIFPFLSALSDTVKKSEQAYHTAVNNPITAETSRHTYNSKLYTIMIIVQQFNSSKSQLETKRRRKSPLVCHFYARPRSSCKYV